MSAAHSALGLLLSLSALSNRGPQVAVGSKKFTESVLLGELARELISQSGIPVTHRAELGGTRILWDALLHGDIDLYPEYTGTLRAEILGGGDAAPTLDGLRKALALRGVVLGPAMGFDDTYALGMPSSLAQRLGIARLSQLGQAGIPALRFGLSHEFMERADGWPALKAGYGLDAIVPRGLDHDLAYRAISTGAIDVTDLYSTDPEIRADHLTVLEDDRHIFPQYQAVFLLRADLAQRVPGAVEAVNRLAGRISASDMLGMNAQAQLEKAPADQVAARFLAERFGLHPQEPVATLSSRLWQRTREHMFLVAISLLAAVAVSIPLGILAARMPRLGTWVLGLVGVVQTIPSLALLVFMIPLLGIGTWPAIAALFLYSLLPIVRNTHAGLSGIAPELRDSGLALGLPAGARLRLIELPLAAPSILAGIKTAAVINVGTATLGALIGAGGYGQPILTGIRLDDIPMILEGAVPAAVLALAVQALFDLAERALIHGPTRPRGATD